MKYNISQQFEIKPDLIFDITSVYPGGQGGHEQTKYNLTSNGSNIVVNEGDIEKFFNIFLSIKHTAEKKEDEIIKEKKNGSKQTEANVKNSNR